MLLAGITGVLSYFAIPILEKANTETFDDTECGSEVTSAVTTENFFSKKNWKKWIYVGFISFICALAMWLSANAGVATMDLCRQLTVFLALASAMIIDSKTHLIPNFIVLIALGIGTVILLIEFVFVKEDFASSLLMSCAGLVCCVVFFYVLSRLTKEGLGMGDVKLIAVMGWLLGLASTLTAVLFALIICTVVSVFLLFGRKKSRNDRIPFGPFLFWGYVLMFIVFCL